MGNDKMIIGQGRAMLGINRTSGADFPLRGVMQVDVAGGIAAIPLEIPIISGALMAAAAGATITALLAY